LGGQALPRVKMVSVNVPYPSPDTPEHKCEAFRVVSPSIRSYSGLENCQRVECLCQQEQQASSSESNLVYKLPEVKSFVQ